MLVMVCGYASSALLDGSYQAKTKEATKTKNWGQWGYQAQKHESNTLKWEPSTVVN